MTFPQTGTFRVVGVNIEILYVPDCPNLNPTRDHLDAALKATGLTANVRQTEIDDADKAALVGMRGSPTVIIDGRDAVTSDASAGSLSCRLYPADEGMQGSPSVDQLKEALLR